MKYIKYKYWLGNIKGLRNQTKKELIKYCGNARNVYGEKEENLRLVPGITMKELQHIALSKLEWDIENKYGELGDAKIRYVTIEETEYPDNLKMISDAPYGLFVKGNLPDETKVCVAVVGARNSSIYGRNMAKDIAGRLGECGVEVISGLARGIDSFGHKGALIHGGKTYGILGCGVDVCYPKENFELYMDILSSGGGIISEQPLKTPPLAYNFPLRNRIIGAMADVVVVVEAKEKSGSLITADLALEYGRDVMAVPGKITDEYSRGCNRLIKQGADMVCDVEDILENVEKIAFLRGKQYRINGRKCEKRNIILEKKELLVYSCLSLEPKNLEEILEEVPLTYIEVINILTDLELREMIEEIAKNYYVINSPS